METTSTVDERSKVWELIKDIKIALMTTQDDYGDLVARPMSAVQAEFSGDLWFFSKNDSRKVEHILGNPKVLLAYSNPEKQEYVSVAGTAETTVDKAKIHELWREVMRVWFPLGPDDPSIMLIKVAVTSAEYWDSPSSTMVLAYAYFKARLTGSSPQLGANKRVEF